MTKPKTMLLLDKRAAQLGTSISTNRELHGEEKVPRKDIPITTTINRNELCGLLRETLAAEALFNEKSSGFFEPLFQGKIGPIPLTGKFEQCNAVIFVGIDLRKIKLHDIKLTNLKIDPQVGGMTELKCMLQYHSAQSDDVAELDNWLDQEIAIKIEVGKLAEVQQKQLALGEPTTAAQAIAEDEAEQETVEEQAASDRALLDGHKAKPKRARPVKSKPAKARDIHAGTH
ncbi:MAG TPA: hypothetical protein VGL34_25025 [Steroidobacteraceae bacterium]|jgi:hypothetical protein